MTSREPLAWTDAGHAHVSIDGEMPDCEECREFLARPWYTFVRPSAELAREFVDTYHWIGHLPAKSEPDMSAGA